MTFKELIRTAIYNEMDDVTAFGEEAETFGADPRVGEEMKALFGRLADEKRERLKELGKIFKEGTGFRQRAAAPARSLEAALRTHITRSELTVRVYAGLLRELNKPEFKEAVAAMLLREREETLAGVRRLQAALKGN